MSAQRELRAFWSLFYRDMLKLFRERARIISALTQPIIFLGIFGIGLKDVLGATGPFTELDYIQYIFPGVMGTNVLGLTISSGVTLVADREFGFLREVLVAPISRLTISLAKIAAGIGNALVQVAMLLLLAPFLGLELGPLLVLKLLGAVSLLALATSALGLLIASRVRSVESFQYLFQFLIFPIFFLSGAFFVLSKVPWWLRAVANINPLTYAIDLFRHILYAPEHLSGQSRDALILNSVATDALVIAVISIVLTAAATYSFTRQD